MNKDKKPLSETHPELAKQAHGWDPKTVVAGSGKKLEWKCEKSHIWSAIVQNRTKKNSGCSVCNNRYVLSGFNDLATTHPELAKQAHGWDPKTVVTGSHKKLEWVCEKGHRWFAAVIKRTGEKTGCPYCSNSKLKIGFNDLETLHPLLAKQAHLWDPKQVLAGSGKRLEWKCDKDHLWTTTADSRITNESGCPICSNRTVESGFNDLATTHPELAKQAHGWNPKTVVTGSHKNLEWACEKGHLWRATVQNRTGNKSNCPVCVNQKTLIGFNDLATTHPELAKQAHGWDPKTVVAGSNKRLSWVCQKGHIWNATVTSVVISKSSCPVCINQKTLTGFNDLATTHPELAKQAHGWDPKTVVAGSGKKLEWKCEKGHLWRATVNGRALSKTNCPYCTNIFNLVGFNDLETIHPSIAKQAHLWDPKQVLAGSGKRLEWKCDKGHFWFATVDSRVSKETQCPVCVNRTVESGFNDLATTHPEIAKQAHGWDPKTVVAGSGKKLEWKCENGHLWKTTVTHRTNDRNCPSCSVTGFDPNKDGYLYFIIQPVWEIYQVGITNFPKDRLNRHNTNGFELLELRGPMDGHTAQELETAILRYLKSQNADLSPEHIAGKFDGYTESWTIDSYKVNNLKELIDKASEAGY